MKSAPCSKVDCVDSELIGCRSNPNFCVPPSRYQSVSWRASSNSLCDSRNFSTLAQCVFEGGFVDMIACSLSNRRESLFQVGKIGLEIDFFQRPGVLDNVTKHIVEDRIGHIGRSVRQRPGSRIFSDEECDVPPPA